MKHAGRHRTGMNGVSRRRLLSVAAGGIACMALPSVSLFAAQENRRGQRKKKGADGLFGSREIMSSDMSKFAKWADLWRRNTLPRTETVAPARLARPGRSAFGRDCTPQERLSCARAEWDALIESQAGTPPLDILRAVNRYMNRSPYIVDPVNWGMPDYWATPDEFFLRDGDCEDYAISKYVTLKRIGFAPDSMRLVILQDENLKAAHAILSIELDGEIYILDNQVDAVLPHGRILHYRPVYSINESHWWLHQVRRFSRF